MGIDRRSGAETPSATESGKLSGEYDPAELEPLKQLPSSGQSGDVRTRFEKDRDRVIHCAAFRRLQGKTQVFGLGSSDFFRTRLTHSLEVAQIAKGIALKCRCANTELVEAASLAHDIGHPPFGHTGESVLKERMQIWGGFEANAQNLRILERIEVRTADRSCPGLNLSRATLDAVLKYKKPYSRVDRSEPIEEWKFYYDDDDEIVRFASSDNPQFGVNSFESEVMDWADDIAYSTHDVEDGIKVGMISESKISGKIEDGVRERVERKGLQWNAEIWDRLCERIRNVSRQFDSHHERKGERRDMIRRLIDRYITSTSAEKRQGALPWSRYAYTLVLDQDIEVECNMLKSLVWELIINDERVATLQRKAVNIVNRLFDEFAKFDDESRTKEMYPGDFREKLAAASCEEQKVRIACDYISGMTDAYAARMYSRVTEGELGSLFDIL